VSHQQVETVVPVPASVGNPKGPSAATIVEIELTVRNVGGKAAPASCLISVHDGTLSGSATVRTPATIQPESAADLSATIDIPGHLGASDLLPSTSCSLTGASSATSTSKPADRSGLPVGFPVQFPIPEGWLVRSATEINDTASGLPVGSRSYEVTFQTVESPTSAFSLLTDSLRSQNWTVQELSAGSDIPSTSIRGFGYQGSVAVTELSTQPETSQIDVTLEGS
jgi:hypothetical protein